MLDTKLHNYLKGFRSSDWESFMSFLHWKAPHQRDIIKLAQHIHRHKDNLESPRFDIGYIGVHVLTGKKRKGILNTYSKMTRYVTSFLAHDQLNQDEGLKEVLQLKALNDRKLYGLSNKLHKKAKRKLEQKPYDFWNYLYRHLLDHNYFVSDNPSLSKDCSIVQSALNNGQKYFAQISAFYLLTKNNNLRIGYSDFSNLQFDTQNVATTELQDIFTKLNNVVTSGDLADTYDLFVLLKMNHADLSPLIRLFIYTLIKAQFVSKINNGDLTFGNSLLSLNELMIDHNYLLYNGEIRIIRIVNIILAAIFLGKPQWAIQTLKSYQKFIPISSRREYKSIAQILTSFAKKDYSQVLSSISIYYPKELLIKSLINRLEIIALLESQEYSRSYIQSKIDNYKNFIYRNKGKLSERVYTGSINFSNVSAMINKGQSFNHILNAIEHAKPLLNRLYLMQSIKETMPNSPSSID